MHKCDYSDEIINRNGKVVLIVSAEYAKKDICFEVYQEDEDGECCCRNIYQSIYCGRVIAVPGLPFSRYDRGAADIEPYGLCDQMNFFSCALTGRDKEIIRQVHPDFVSYVLPKWDTLINKADAIHALQIWKKYPKIELLLAAGFEKVAFNKSFYNLSEEKQKKVCSFILKHPECKEFTLAQIKEVLRINIPIDDYNAFLKARGKFYTNKVSYEVFKYLEKQSMVSYEGLSLYRDYAKLLKETNHNKKDLYWKYPKNLRQAHSKVLEEVNAIHALQKQKELEELQEKYIETVKCLEGFSSVVDGYEIYVPQDLNDWNVQADTLHQCIVQCKYYNKVKDNYCLVFIRREGVPVATVEIVNKEKKIGQFYGNEIDRANCKPSDEVRNAFNKWLENFSFVDAA